MHSHQEVSNPHSAVPLNRITLRDLQIVLEIYHGKYSFAGVHPDIANCYMDVMKNPSDLGGFFLMFGERSVEIQLVAEICRVTQAEAAPNIAPELIVVSDENAHKLNEMLSKYRMFGLERQGYALMQLDGVLTNFNYTNKDSDHKDFLRFICLTNMLPLPAAMQYFLDHIDELNQSNILVATVANSAVESALILINYLSPRSLFNKDKACGNTALELAIAKGRNHIDFAVKKNSSLPIGKVIDAIISIAKRDKVTASMLHDDNGKLPQPIELALIQADLETVKQLMDAGVTAYHDGRVLGYCCGTRRLQLNETLTFKETNLFVDWYTVCGTMFGMDENRTTIPVDNIIFDEERSYEYDNECKHSSCYSILRRDLWEKNYKECLEALQAYRHACTSRI
jgi:hypothetical protein